MHTTELIDSLAEDIAFIGDSEFFDRDWYCEHYPDVELVGLNPAEHYLRIGAYLLRDPGPHFSTRHYLETHRDVAAMESNPLLHYLRHGRREGRSIGPNADEPGAPRKAVASLPTLTAKPQARQVRHPGTRTPTTQPTVMVCAHMAGPHLYGGERSFLDIVEALAGLDFNVVVTVPLRSHSHYIGLLRPLCIEVIELEYRWWAGGDEISEPAVAAFARLIQEMSVAAVHANTIMLREPLIAARRMGVPAVVHVRELVTYDASLCNVIGLTAPEIIDQVLARADHVIANSRATGLQFTKPGATHTLPNTVDVEQFAVANPVDPARIRVALVSSNLPKKGIFDFVEIARIVGSLKPNVEFVLIGPDNEYTDALRAQQADGLVPGNLVFAGYFERPLDAMLEANIVVNLSHFQESFGRTVLEAMAASRVVVTYDWGALGELVVDRECGYVVPFGDVTQVADRIMLLAQSPDLLEEMGKAGRKRACALYGKTEFAARLKQIYEVILSAAPARDKLPALTLPARSTWPVTGAAAPMRIAYFLWHFPVPSETFVLNELRILVEKGYDVRVFCRRSPHPDFVPDFDIRFDAVESPQALAQALRESGRTIVHSHFTYPTVTDMVWPACEVAGIPFTFIAHAQDIFRHGNDQKNRIGEIGRSRFCSRVVVPSRFHRDYVAARGVPEEKILINPNGIDPDLYRAGWCAQRTQRTRRSVCAVHRFTEKKGLANLIRAGRRLALDGIQVHLYGYGDLQDEYHSLIAELGVTNVHVHGPVDGRESMLEIFRQHDLFICPSVRAADGDMDGIPTVLMEAMASGLPVLASPISGIPDLVSDEVTGLLCEAEADAIAERILDFYQRPAGQVEAMIDEAAARVGRDFNAVLLTCALLRVWEQQTIDVVIVSWNNLAQLREVIRRLYKFTTAPFHLVICDNGSEADVTAYLCDLYASRDNVSIVLNRINVMVGPGTNIALANSHSPYAFYVCGKEGFVLDFGWERRAIDYMETHPETGLAGTLCHSPSYLYGRQLASGIALFPKFRNPGFATNNPQRKFCHVQGGFFVLRREMFQAIGGFSNEVAHAYTDVEYSFHVESNGWRLGQAPGLLSLYNKTRPDIFTRVDESVAAIHPPTVENLQILDTISSRTSHYCNLCGRLGQVFELRNGVRACRNCGSTPADRSLYRYIAESILPYRRLPGLGIGVGTALAAFWSEQFPGELWEFSRLAREIELPRQGAGILRVIYVDLEPADFAKTDVLLRAAASLLAPEGCLILRAAAPDPRLPSAQVRLLEDAAAAAGLIKAAHQRRYASTASLYDWAPLLMFETPAS